MADHKKKMAERKAQFNKEFEHVWASGKPGVSVI